MIIAGIGTLIQLYPIWRIGSGLPVVMGLSFTFLAACLSTASQDYGIISPLLSSCVVIAIGLSILNVGLISMTHVVNRYCIMFGALAMILGGLFPPIGAFFTNLPAIFGDIFAGNMVAGVFVVGLIMELCLPKDPARYEARQEDIKP